MSFSTACGPLSGGPTYRNLAEVPCCPGCIGLVALGFDSRRSRTKVRSRLRRKICLALPSLDCMDVTVRRSGVPIAPGAQIGLRRRNVSFAEANKKAPFSRGFFYACCYSCLLCHSRPRAAHLAARSDVSDGSARRSCNGVVLSVMYRFRVNECVPSDSDMS
jgi:hypothetical protein